MFDAETLRFLAELKAQNTRDWFAANRARFEAHVAAPAQAFLTAFAAELTRQTGAPVSGKLYRLHRDIRFSRDKTPYNAHVHLGFAEPERPFGWLVGLEPGRLSIGYGTLAFPAPLLDRWRDAVAGPGGAALAQILDALQAGGMRLDPPELKRVPAPLDPAHPQGALLRRKSLALWHDTLPPEDAFGADAPQRLADSLARVAPLRGWSAANL